LHDGRIEISVPYTVGVTVLLVAILLILGAFRLGQMQRGTRVPAVKNVPSVKTNEPVRQPDANPAKNDVPAPPGESSGVEPAPGNSTVAPASQGDHVIVLAQHPRREDLEAAQAYFEQQGIATRVIAVEALREYLSGQGFNTNVLGDRGGFMLVTGDYYDNPRSPGTNGYAARQKIVEVGRAYKAPQGFEKFAPKYFSDAYGMKVR
jgi:hypothetical protein